MEGEVGEKGDNCFFIVPLHPLDDGAQAIGDCLFPTVSRGNPRSTTWISPALIRRRRSRDFAYSQTFRLSVKHRRRREKGDVAHPSFCGQVTFFFPFFTLASFSLGRDGGFLSLNPASFRHRLWVACWTLIDEMVLAFSASATGDGRREGLHRRR